MRHDEAAEDASRDSTRAKMLTLNTAFEPSTLDGVNAHSV